MFNFFDEVKSKAKNINSKINPYRFVMVGNHLLYVEGFTSIMTYTTTLVVFKVKGGVITTVGKDISIREMTSSTLTLEGEISQLELV